MLPLQVHSVLYSDTTVAH